MESIYREIRIQGTPVTNELLRERLDRRLKKDIDRSSVCEFFAYFIERAPEISVQHKDKTAPRATKTIQQFQSTLRYLRAYEDEYRVILRFEDLTQFWHSTFISFLEKKRLANNTIGTRIKDIKTIARNAETEGIAVNRAVFSKKFFKPSENSEHIYLNEEEIAKIEALDLSSNARLDNARDWLLIGVWTGLRVSDFSRLSCEQIKSGIISIESQKTGQRVAIPVHSTVQNILQKRAGQFPRRISDQRLNDFFKEVCQLAGIDDLCKGTTMNKTEHGMRKVSGIYPKYQLISTHTCRRSFATNHYGKLPSLTIMAITGHKTESIFLKYVKVTPEEHARALAALWQQKTLKAV